VRVLRRRAYSMGQMKCDALLWFCAEHCLRLWRTDVRARKADMCIYPCKNNRR